MSFIQREFDRLHNALGDEQINPHYRDLYVAQQALAWCLDPNAFSSPIEMIMGIQGEKEDCLVEPRQPPS